MNRLCEMVGVREYGEGKPVALALEEGRLVIVAMVDSGHNATSVDLLDVLKWVEQYKGDILASIK